MAFCEILDLSCHLQNMSMYPYFDIARCALCGLSVREDLGNSAKDFSKNHPVTCWLSYMMCVFAGGMVCNALLGEPMIDSMKNNNLFLLATCVWIFIFLTPHDIGFKILSFPPVKFTCLAMRELYRCKGVHDGVKQVNEIYPDAYFIMVLIGTLKGNGAGITQLIERLIRGVWPPAAVELMHSSFWTKASFVAASLFVFNSKTCYICIPQSLIYLAVSIFFVTSSCLENLDRMSDV